ncbi:DUF490 domain-containing protein [Prolixibacter bellariivorans]|uniref:DUF490 domain-containing protein n=2 Tax=Prolixibacter bellariivorans TaxID=314319 RepID=A0A5M4AV08_9BACT|nr:translocation/assembly module TamB [Prolixibacter bellariivorans]GET31789.1 DUF490 domain-containing protein [Prolixibacter bellariivorans]
MLVLVSLPVLAYLTFRSNKVQLRVVQWVTQQLSATLNTQVSVQGVDIALFHQIVLEGVLIKDQANDTLIYAKNVKADIDSIRLQKRSVHFSNLYLWDAEVNLRKDSSKLNLQFLIDSLNAMPADTVHPWKVTFDNVHLRNSEFKYRQLSGTNPHKHGVNFHDVAVHNLNLSLLDYQDADSAMSFRIDHLSFKEKSGFAVKNIAFNARIDSSTFTATNFFLETDSTRLDAAELQFSPRTIPVDSTELTQNDELYPFLSKLNNYQVNSQFNDSRVSLHDLAYFVPSLWGMDAPFHFSGVVRGTVDNFKIRDFKFRIGKYTRFQADLDMQGLPDWQKTYIFFKFYDNTFDFRDLAALKLPEGMKPIRIPKQLLDSVQLTYRGNFTGFPSDFVAYGTLNGDLGQISSDLAFKPTENGKVDFEGRVITRSFDLGKVLNNQSLGAISMRTKLNGTRLGNGKFSAKIQGMIDSLYYNNYRIKSIYLNGNARERGFDGEIYADDPNLQFFFSGKADLEPKIPVFNFTTTVDKANLYVLGLDKKVKNASVSFGLEANFRGSNFDNMNGEINFDQISYTRDIGTLDLSGVNLKTENSPEHNSISLRSDFVDLDMDGKYRFNDILLSFRDYVQHYLPSAKLPFAGKQAVGENRFHFNLQLKESDQLSKFFLPELEAKPPVRISGNFDSNKHLFNLDGFAPDITYQNNEIEGFSLRARSDADRTSIRAGINKVTLKGKHDIYNLTLNNTAFNDSLATWLTWNNTDTVTYSGEVNTLTTFSRDSVTGRNHTEVAIHPTKIWVADSLWQIEPSHLTIDSTRWTVADFHVHHRKEEFKVDGVVSKNPDDKLDLSFGNLKLGDFSDLLDSDLMMSGTLDGKASFSNLYRKLVVSGDLGIMDLIFQDTPLGDVSIKSNWDPVRQKVVSSLNLTSDGKDRLDISGAYTPDSNRVDYLAKIKGVPLQMLYPFMTSFADQFSGEGYGNLRMSGNLDKPRFDGDVFVQSGKIGIDYLKTNYDYSDTVFFKNDSIIFNRILLRDADNHIARLDGTIRHTLFSDMKYDLSVTTADIEVLNTTARDNNLFYGKAHASGGIRITGERQHVRLDISLRTEPGTQIFLPMERPESASEYNFITFVNSTKTDSTQHLTVKKPENNSDFEMYMDVEATPSAKVQIIFDSTIGDVIKGQGNGNLRLVYDREGNFRVYGDYVVEKGDYLFTLQNVINKKFRIEQGGTISWNGDPYDAVVNLDAVYKLRASLYDLLLNTSNEGDYSRRIPVEVKINLSKKLFNPAVKFDIEFPTADKRTRDEVQQYISTQDEINRQILSLLVMGQFYTPEYLRGNQNFETTGASMVNATTSEMLSNQLSNWLSQISNDFDIGFNYRPGDQVSNREIEVALSTQILDDRVTINGNIGNNGSLQSSNTNQIVGEVEVYVNLDKSGKLQLKAYNRSNDDLIYDTSPYTQGIGISFREEFDSFDDLFQRYFKKSQEKKREQALKKKRKKAAESSSGQ